MTLSATCMHCTVEVLTKRPELGAPEIRALQHHLLRRCAPQEPLSEDLGKLLVHFRVTIKD
jgi:hypothetical protein